MKKQFVLVENRILKPSDYAMYFGVCERTAGRYYARDKKELLKNVMTYLDFYRLYDAFPDKSFTATWKEIDMPPMEFVTGHTVEWR